MIPFTDAQLRVIIADLTLRRREVERLGRTMPPAMRLLLPTRLSELTRTFLTDALGPEWLGWWGWRWRTFGQHRRFLTKGAARAQRLR